ncbi:MAG: hypothetical protein OQK65_00590, partial [Chlorobium sp.]|nr:hypothetical protein [Chlorobium sp.]
MIKGLKKNNYLGVYLALIALINLFLLTLPLTNVFGYEFSAVNALLLSFLSGLYIITYLQTKTDEQKSNQNRLPLKAFSLTLIIPFAISILKSIIFGFCSFWDGLWFYLVITCPSVIIGSALGAMIFSIVKKFRKVSFIVLYLLILFIPVFEIYFNPQIYLYNPLFAYFPGTIYDEGLVVDFNLFLYRIFNLLFFATILFYVFKWKKQSGSISISKIFFSFIIIVLLFFYFIISPKFSFTTTDSSLRSHLSNQIESEHFIILADERISKEDIKQIILNQEFYYSQLSKFFEDKPIKKFTSYIFYDRNQKKELFGSANADVAKPWLYSVYISFDSWESTLKHEIAHCFTADFGWGIFKLASGFNPALIEGAAESADGFYDENSIHYLAALAYKNNYKINIESLLESFSFFGSVSSLSYIYSGSFVKYLISNYGIAKFKLLYQTNDFEKIYNKDLLVVTKNYEKFLDTLKLTATKEKADYYYGRKSLISKVCPRYISSSLEKAWSFYLSKDYLDAEDIFRDILSKSENYSAVVGLSKIYEDSDSLKEAINLLQTNIKTFSGTSTEFELKFRLADLYIKNSELTKAEALYDSISEVRPSRRLKILADSRIALINEETIQEYVSGSDFDKYLLLKKLNSKFYNYATIPLMIDLSALLEEDYHLFLDNFKDNFAVVDEISSYAVYKISVYMISNFDYANARKYAGLALRYKGNPNLTELYDEQFKKADWFVKNANRVFNKTNFGQN